MGVQKGKHLWKDMLLQILVAFSIIYTTPRRRTARYSGVYGLPSTALGSSGSDYEGSLGSRNPGFYGYPKIDNIKRSACVSLTETCAARAGLMGSLLKFPCCPGSTCTLVGHSFKCLPLSLTNDNESDYDDGEPDYYD